MFVSSTYVLAEVGTQVKIYCNSSVLPKWYKRNTASLTFITASYMLTFLNITTEDRGVYICEGNGWDMNQTKTKKISNLQVGCM